MLVVLVYILKREDWWNEVGIDIFSVHFSFIHTFLMIKILYNCLKYIPNKLKEIFRQPRYLVFEKLGIISLGDVKLLGRPHHLGMNYYFNFIMSSNLPHWFKKHMEL